jgi:AcrR family transcriptional regulator
MDDFVVGRPPIYKSDVMFERRQRVLREARKIIAEDGLADFSVRRLCALADIAPRTLYNAFGSKANVIALAVRQYFTEFSERAHHRFDPATLEGVLEMLIKIHSRNVQARSYTSALMSVYHSGSADSSLRDLLRSLGQDPFRLFLSRCEEAAALRPHVTTSTLTYFLFTHSNAVLSDWCLGDIADEQLVDRVSETVLALIAGATVGALHREAEQWLQDLREQRPSWKAMRKLAEVAPADLRDAAFD